MSITFSASAARAQAMGSHFATTPADPRQAAALLRGELQLSPHRTWALPAAPKWNEDPFREINWVAQFHMLRWIDPLRRIADAGDTSGVDLWVAIVTSWIEANPPGRGRATYSWGDMVEAVRAMTMCFGLPMLAAHRPDALPAVLESIEQHGLWLEDPKHIRIGNHALQQHQGLLVIGAVLQRQSWIDLAIERMVTMLRNAYDEEGINEEGSVQYHQINYNWWTLTKRRVELVCGEAPDEFARIERAPLGLAHATRPDGTYELIGDTEIYSLRGIPHPAVEYVSSAGNRGAPPPERVKIYRSGYVFGRSGWGDERRGFADQSFYSLRFGPQDRIHGHVDGGAFTFYRRGASILVDGGKYAYDAKDPLRAHLLSRQAHNAVYLRDRTYDRTSVVELLRSRLWAAGEDFEFLDEGYSGAEILRRVTVLWDLQAILVTDDITSVDETTAAQVWHLDPAAGHRKEDGAVLAVQRAGGETLQTWFLPLSSDVDVSVVKGRTSPWQGWTSGRWREKAETRTIEISRTGQELRLRTLIDFSDTPTRPSITQTTVPGEPSVEVIEWSTPDGAPRQVAIGPDWCVTDCGGASPQDLARLGRDSFGI